MGQPLDLLKKSVQSDILNILVTLQPFRYQTKAKVTSRRDKLSRATSPPHTEHTAVVGLRITLRTWKDELCGAEAAIGDKEVISRRVVPLRHRLLVVDFLAVWGWLLCVQCIVQVHPNTETL